VPRKRLQGKTAQQSGLTKVKDVKKTKGKAKASSIDSGSDQYSYPSITSDDIRMMDDA